MGSGRKWIVRITTRSRCHFQKRSPGDQQQCDTPISASCDCISHLMLDLTGPGSDQEPTGSVVKGFTGPCCYAIEVPWEETGLMTEGHHADA
jgi:hypothetical protein